MLRITTLFLPFNFDRYLIYWCNFVQIILLATVPGCNYVYREYQRSRLVLSRCMVYMCACIPDLGQSTRITFHHTVVIYVVPSVCQHRDPLCTHTYVVRCVVGIPSTICVTVFELTRSIQKAGLPVWFATTQRL